ncbi:MAG: 50S ribosomal protein L28 [Candidatus Paceibacterota bacterium]|jgi:ribosomal protein L28
MAKACPLCARTSASGGGYSNRVRATKFNPTGTVAKKVNLQWAKIKDGSRMKICTRCIKGNKNLTATR